jgi:hypothetical protein
MAIWCKFRLFGIVGGHLVYFSGLICLDQEKSGNPDSRVHAKKEHLASGKTLWRLRFALWRVTTEQQGCQIIIGT